MNEEIIIKNKTNSELIDKAICEHCLEELFQPHNRRYLYPYIGCPTCGPKYTLLKSLPLKRENTTLQKWEMCDACRSEYEDPTDRRYRSELNSCPNCGPSYFLYYEGTKYSGEMMLQKVVKLLHDGEIIAIKSNGGYHLVCDAMNKETVKLLREKIHRKRKPFAMMVKDIEAAESIVTLSIEEKRLLLSDIRPIVLAESKGKMNDVVAPNNKDLGIMLPYTALHHLLFHFGAPKYLIMTSANFPGEPTIHEDEQMISFAKMIKCACLIGERPIERSVDDSVVKHTKQGILIIRKSRGIDTKLNITMPTKQPILALGADLKNTITLVKEGKVWISHHLGDLTKYYTQLKFEKMIESFLHMFNVPLNETIIGHDLHPSYFTSQYAKQLNGVKLIGIQHHEAHLASVLASKNVCFKRVIGYVFDGTGYGTNGEIWGGEVFVGSLHEGFKRIGHLRRAKLVGGDAAARMPVQALAGFFDNQNEALQIKNKLKLPERFVTALKIKEKNINSYPMTSMGRLFDAVAAILGFHQEISFEGEAAIWLEHIATKAPYFEEYSFPWTGREFDYRPLLNEIIETTLDGKDSSVIARSFHRSLARAVVESITSLSEEYSIHHIVLSGGVFQNSLLISDLTELLQDTKLQIIFSNQIPVNDNCISLGQAAMIANHVSNE